MSDFENFQETNASAKSLVEQVVDSLEENVFEYILDLVSSSPTQTQCIDLVEKGLLMPKVNSKKEAMAPELLHLERHEEGYEDNRGGGLEIITEGDHPEEDPEEFDPFHEAAILWDRRHKDRIGGMGRRWGGQD